MKRLSFALIGSVLAFMPGARADVRVATVGPWQVDAVEGAGRPLSCRASRREGELLFSFTRTGTGSGVLLSTEKWKLDRGTAYRVTLAAPPAQPFSGQARASAGNELELAVTPEFLRSLEGKTELDVKPVATSFRVSLARVGEVLRALDECWTARTAAATPAAPAAPAAPAPAAPAPAALPASPPDAAKQSIVSETILPSDLEALSRAVFGTTETRLQPLGGGGYNIVAGPTVTIVRSASVTGPLDAVLVVVGETLSSNCQGPASPAITQLDTAGLVKSARLELGCDTARGAVRFDTTVVSDGQRFQSYTSVGRDREAVNKAGTRFYAELRKAYR
jgi:hypothetical protein